MLFEVNGKGSHTSTGHVLTSCWPPSGAVVQPSSRPNVGINNPNTKHQHQHQHHISTAPIRTNYSPTAAHNIPLSNSPLALPTQAPSDRPKLTRVATPHPTASKVMACARMPQKAIEANSCKFEVYPTHHHNTQRSSFPSYQCNNLSDTLNLRRWPVSTREGF